MYVKLHDKAERLRFTVPCAAYVADDENGLLLLELVGADSENRAVWSHIVKARSERSLTATSAHFHAGASKDVICVVPNTKYHKVEQSGRVILLHDGLTRFRYEYLLGGDDDAPSPWFMLALQQHIPIPVLSHWAPVIRAKARELSLVRPADVSFGPAVVWQLDLNQNTWERMIQDLVKARKVTVEAR
jgi:hypothetical protein